MAPSAREARFKNRGCKLGGLCFFFLCAFTHAAYVFKCAPCMRACAGVSVCVRVWEREIARDLG